MPGFHHSVAGLPLPFRVRTEMLETSFRIHTYTYITSSSIKRRLFSEAAALYGALQMYYYYDYYYYDDNDYYYYNLHLTSHE